MTSTIGSFISSLSICGPPPLEAFGRRPPNTRRRLSSGRHPEPFTKPDIRRNLNDLVMIRRTKQRYPISGCKRLRTRPRDLDNLIAIDRAARALKGDAASCDNEDCNHQHCQPGIAGRERADILRGTTGYDSGTHR